MQYSDFFPRMKIRPPLMAGEAMVSSSSWFSTSLSNRGAAETTVHRPSVLRKKIRPSAAIGEALYWPFSRSFHLRLPLAASKQRAMPSSVTVKSRSLPDHRAAGVGRAFGRAPGDVAEGQLARQLRLHRDERAAQAARREDHARHATVGPVTVRPPTSPGKNQSRLPLAGS